MNELFLAVDSKSDQAIDLEEWVQNIINEDVLLMMLKDVIFKNRLQTDDVLKTMGLRREQENIGLAELRDGIKKVDGFFNDTKASRVAKSILRGQGSIAAKDLIECLGCADGKAHPLIIQ